MDLTTRLTLLGEMKSGMGYEKFQEIYRNRLVDFARKQGLQDCDAEDVYQETFLVLWRVMPKFNYDPKRGKFRNFLFTIVARKVLEAKRRSKTDKLVSLNEALADVAVAQPDEKMEADWQECLLAEAWRQIKADERMDPETLKIFKARKLEGKSAKQVGEDFHLQPNAVDQRIHNTLERLRKEVKALAEGSEFEK